MRNKYIVILGVVIGSLIAPLGAATVTSTPSSGMSTSGTVNAPNGATATTNPDGSLMTTVPNAASGPVQSPGSGVVTSPNGTGAYQPNMGH